MVRLGFWHILIVQHLFSLYCKFQIHKYLLSIKKKIIKIEGCVARTRLTSLLTVLRKCDFKVKQSSSVWKQRKILLKIHFYFPWVVYLLMHPFLSKFDPILFLYSLYSIPCRIHVLFRFLPKNMKKEYNSALRYPTKKKNISLNSSFRGLQ